MAVAASLAGVAAVAGGAAFKRRRGADGEPGEVSPGELASGGDEAKPTKKHRHWTCECGQDYRVTGEDRHQVFWLEGAAESDPVLGDQCPECDRPLPHHGAAETTA